MISQSTRVMTTAGGTGSITLSFIDAAGSLFLKQDSTNILSWNDAGECDGDWIDNADTR